MLSGKGYGDENHETHKICVNIFFFNSVTGWGYENHENRKKNMHKCILVSVLRVGVTKIMEIIKSV